ncbi:MAG: hypothetical protein ACO3JL_10660 [Myxococcota bacterium]
MLFTERDSHEFNAIEKAWAKVKDLLRKAETRTREAIGNAVAAALPQITTGDIRAWTKHCGYTVNAI